MTKEKEEMQSRMAEEMRTMQKNIERLQKMETVLEKEGQKLSHQKELQERLKVVYSNPYKHDAPRILLLRNDV